MIDLTSEVLNGLTVGQFIEALKDQDPLSEVTIFANGELWTPKQIMCLESGEDIMSDDKLITGRNIIEIGCGWTPRGV